ncbi:hypothetical protein ACFRQM_09535 [Streptomyces sp. NPDC056831]|uniref:hypothetical protein n=1 Tax=Streptomyces sp. NPDC056831 TaxID=3345954 RepID=UPI0036C791D2
MGQSANAMLAYGYDLGGEEEWALRDLGEYGELPALGWYDPETEDDEDFQAAAERRLLAELASFTEKWDPADGGGYFDRKRAAKARLGVQFDSHCSGEYPMYLLAAQVITVDHGSVEEINPAELLATPPEWDTKLRAALDALGINPTQETARWLLCSYRD